MAYDDSNYCSDCKKETQVTYDHAAGDLICHECGLVLDSHIADETAEYRTFDNNEGEDRDPVRVGAPSNPFLQGHDLLDTTIDFNNVKDKNAVPVLRLRNPVDKSRSSLVNALGSIDEICDRLGVYKTVKDLACDIYTKVNPFLNPTKRDNNFAAACVHIASQKLNQSRTLKEMKMAAGGLAEKKIVIAKNTIIRILNEKLGSSSASIMELGNRTDQQVNDYLKRFAYDVGLNNQAIKAAQEILRKSEEHDIRRTPKSIAAGIVYVTCLLCGHKRSARDISIVANTSDGTIKKAYNDLYPYLRLIVPSWFASQGDIMKLPAP